MRDIVNTVTEVVAAGLAAVGPERQVELLNAVRQRISERFAPVSMPVDVVRWVPVEAVRPNDYNPNIVPPSELALLKRSIMADGYTQPIVAMWNAEACVYEIVDGFHRYLVACDPQVSELTGGLVPIVVIDKPVNDRMASTVRHNRARGSHGIGGMGKIVFTLLRNGWSDSAICQELGMSADELVRVKHITGYAKLFKDAHYSEAFIFGTAIAATEPALHAQELAGKLRPDDAPKPQDHGPASPQVGA